MFVMPLAFRLATAADYPNIENMVIASFEPISWVKRLENRFGLLNGQDWRASWRTRMRNIFASQIVLIGEADNELAAMSSGTLDPGSAMAYIDVLAVDRRFIRRGYGREMLRGMMAHMKSLGGQYVYLDCLIDNDPANALYRAEGFESVVQQHRYFRKLA
jgi:ribosomal protein S18 acetylase RimI-like enzyme